MRNCYIAFLLCFSTYLQAQTPNRDIAPEDAAFNANYSSRTTPKVTGKLLNMTAEELRNMSITYTIVTPFAKSQVKKITSPKPDGSFSLTLDYPLPYQQIWFSAGNFYTGLYANKDLYLELDMKKINAAKEVNFNGDGVKYLGTDGALNIYLNNFVLYKRSEQLELSSKISSLIYSSQLPAESILPDFNALFDSLSRIQNSYIAANPSPYQWILENEGRSDYYGDIITKYVGKMMDDAIWKKIIQFKPYLVSNSSANLYRNIAFYIKFFPNTRVMVNWKDLSSLPDLDHSELLAIDSLKKSESMQPVSPYTAENIKKWTKQLNPRLQKLNFEKSLAKNIRVIDSLFLPAKADYLKFQLVESTDMNEQKLAFKSILHSMHTPWSKAVLENEYARTVIKVNEINKTLAQSKGGKLNNRFGKSLAETSFGATLYKTSDSKALDFITKLKQNFPGKAIIIDRWATWCGPCLNEMPHSKQLVETSKDLPVVFVYLCTINNSSEEKWKSKVVEIKQPGIHFLINEELDADISKYFSFSGYPGYAFIDKTGTYKPGAFKWMSEIENRESLLTLINK